MAIRRQPKCVKRTDRLWQWRREISASECPGFQGLYNSVTAKFLTIDLLDTQNRPVRDAIIHASQALEQMSVALDSDPAIRPRPEGARVRLLDHAGNVVAGASVR